MVPFVESMLKLNRKLDYAILALAHLSSSERHGAMSARALSERTRVPQALLANILKELGRLGWIRSIRGAHGGYELARDPGSLSVGDLVRQFEGSERLVDCVSIPGLDAPHQCDLEADCPVKDPLRKLHDRIHGVLDEVTFDQLAVRTRSIPSTVGTEQDNAPA